MTQQEMEMFQHIKETNPNITDANAWTRVGMGEQIDNMLNTDPSTFDNGWTDKIVEAIVNGAQRWIERNLPQIAEMVRNALQHILENIGPWIQRGIEWLWETLTDWL